MSIARESRPHILIVTDDGIEAPGLWYLWKSLVDHADLTIVAPSEEQSGVGMALTLKAPLRATAVEGFAPSAAWHVNASPASCVKLAVASLMDRAPDIIVSGINNGANIGRNVFYSGTVGGIIEGVLRGIQGIAFSFECETFDNKCNYSLAARYIPAVVEYVLRRPLPGGTLLNVNFPDDVDDIKGFRMARQGLEYCMEDIVERKHPRDGNSYYWLSTRIATFEETEMSDSHLIRQGYMTATPIRINDLTDATELDRRAEEFEALFTEKSTAAGV